MMKKDNLFLIGQAAKRCGVSRSTILRLEDRGILTPAHIEQNSNGGLRYYDNLNRSNAPSSSLEMELATDCNRCRER